MLHNEIFWLIIKEKRTNLSRLLFSLRHGCGDSAVTDGSASCCGGGDGPWGGLLPAEGCRQRKGNFSQNLALHSNLPQLLFEDPPGSKRGGIHAKSAAGGAEPLLPTSCWGCLPRRPQSHSASPFFLLRAHTNGHTQSCFVS